jgi:putative redox protein
MHHGEIKRFVVMYQGAISQPANEFIAIRCIHHRPEAAVFFAGLDAGSHREQVKIVVTENSGSTLPQPLDETQHLEGVRATIDKVSDKPEGVTRLAESDELEQPHEFCVTALDVPDRVCSQLFFRDGYCSSGQYTCQTPSASPADEADADKRILITSCSIVKANYLVRPMKARVKWVEGKLMVGESGSGHAVVMDGPPEYGGRNLGLRPMEMLLLGMGGCTEFDVLMILEKSRQDVTSCEVLLEAERATEEPKVFTKIHAHFVICGRNLSHKHVERAISLSAEKFCSASIMLGKTAEITHDYEILEA